MDYFVEIEERVQALRREVKHLDAFAKERRKKYENCLHAYEKYVSK